MATETRTDGRHTQLDDRAQMGDQARMGTGTASRNERAEPMRTQQYDPRMSAQPAPAQAQEIRSTGNETKNAFLTTEFWIYLAAVAAVLIASQLVGRTANHADYFRADKAWWFISLLTIGYLGSRGLAKAGSSTRTKFRDNDRR
jgi:hypothetical protein